MKLFDQIIIDMCPSISKKIEEVYNKECILE